MSLTIQQPDFSNLLGNHNDAHLQQQLQCELSTSLSISTEMMPHLQTQWQDIGFSAPHNVINQPAYNAAAVELQATEWLISLFNILFAEQNVTLVRGTAEPEYYPANPHQPARIEFAHGYFASALHEISHWCIAGSRRRLLSDFGYWYAPDGRSLAQQQAFERVEIKPQALECLFTLACGRHFRVSQDNLFADFDTSGSTFSGDVYQQAQQYIQSPKQLPKDAKVLLLALLTICHG